MAKRLLVIDGADQGQFFPVPDEGLVSVGSSSPELTPGK